MDGWYHNAFTINQWEGHAWTSVNGSGYSRTRKGADKGNQKDHRGGRLKSLGFLSSEKRWLGEVEYDRGTQKNSWHGKRGKVELFLPPP